jgi:hypothetical protein
MPCSVISHDQARSRNTHRLFVARKRRTVRYGGDRETQSNGRIWPVRDRDCSRRLGTTSDFRLFGHLQRVVDLYPQVAHGTLELGMTEEELDSPKVLCAPID